MIRKETIQHLQTVYAHVEDAYNREIQAHIQSQITAPLESIAGFLAHIDKACENQQTKCLHDYLNEIDQKKQTVQQLADDLTEPFTLFIIGNGKNGKSTLINALLGQQKAAEGIVPKTWKIDIFQQRANGKCLLTFRDGTKKEMSCENAQTFLEKEEQKCRASSKAIQAELREFKKTHSEASLEACEEQQKKLKKYRLYHSPVIEAVWPVTGSPILEKYRLVDTPGLRQELDDKLTDSVKEYFTKADGIIWILPGDKINSSGDYEELKQLYEESEKKPNNIIAVVNRIDLIRKNGQCVDDVVAEAKKLYGDMITDIIPVSAKEAKEAGMILKQEKLSPEKRKEGEIRWQDSNMEALHILLQRTFLAHALELQIQSKTNNCQKLYQDMMRQADGAIEMLQKADGERQKKKEEWEKESSDTLKSLKQGLDNFEQKEADRVRRETGHLEESLWNMESDARNDYIMHRIIHPEQIEKSLHTLVQEHCQRLSMVTATHLKRAPFQEFPALHDLQVRAQTSSGKAVSPTVLNDDLSDEGTAQLCLGGALAIGAAALLGPVGILFAGIALSDIGRSVAKWLSRTFGDSMAVKVERRVKNQLDTAMEKLNKEYLAYITTSDASITNLREKTYSELYGPSEKKKQIIDTLQQLKMQCVFKIKPLTIKKVIFSGGEQK